MGRSFALTPDRSLLIPITFIQGQPQLPPVTLLPFPPQPSVSQEAVSSTRAGQRRSLAHRRYLCPMDGWVHTWTNEWTLSFHLCLGVPMGCLLWALPRCSLFAACVGARNSLQGPACSQPGTRCVFDKLDAERRNLNASIYLLLPHAIEIKNTLYHQRCI